MNVDWDAVARGIRIAESVVEVANVAITKASPVVGGFVQIGIAGLALGADLIERGLHPIEAITRIRSVAGDFDATKRTLDEYADGKR